MSPLGAVQEKTIAICLLDWSPFYLALWSHPVSQFGGFFGRGGVQRDGRNQVKRDRSSPRGVDVIRTRCFPRFALQAVEEHGGAAVVDCACAQDAGRLLSRRLPAPRRRHRSAQDPTRRRQQGDRDVVSVVIANSQVGHVFWFGCQPDCQSAVFAC